MSNVPNYQGMFLRGYGSQNHSKNNGSITGVTNTNHASAGFGVVQGDVSRNIYGSLVGIIVDSASKNSPYYSYGTDAFEMEYRNRYEGETGKADVAANVNFNSSRISPVGNENRPVNMAVKYLIRAQE